MNKPTDLSIYDNAKHWIAQYEKVDEVKDYMDKAAAMEEYAKRAMNLELEEQALRARIRAERRLGQLLKDAPKAKGATEPNTNRGKVTRSHESTASPATLKDMGISKNLSSESQKLADVPAEKFEKIIEQPGLHSAKGIINKVNPPDKPKPIDNDALYVWGEFRRFQKVIESKDLNDIVTEMTETMQEDMRRFIPIFKQWVDEYELA